MFIDQARITVKAGDGGAGAAHFRREKYVALGGPDGGNGGRGGSIYLRATVHQNTLMSFAHRQEYSADNGEAGQGSLKQGVSGKDLYIDVPEGTVAYDARTGELLGDLTKDGETCLVAAGGRGGRGNTVFKSSTRQAPHFAEKGGPGQRRELRLELKLIADVGLLGKPNAGKSTFLSRISKAHPKIADYPFTTLSPNLGVAEVDQRSFVVADIPGLIEGAHQGVGLGLDFLRHVERTRLLVHLLDGTAEDPLADYEAINKELALYSERLAAKPQIVVLNKIDVTEAREILQLVREALAGKVDHVYAMSGVSGEGLQEVLRAIADTLQALPEEQEPDEMFVFKPAEINPHLVTIEELEPGVWRFSGVEIERLAAMTDWFNDEGAERFERILVSRGVSAQAEEAGVAFGDTVFIGDLELQWD